MLIRDDKTDIGTPEDTALDYNRKIIKGLTAKADHNKFESQFTFAVVVGASLLAPLFVTLGDGQFLGKVVPATLSVSAAAATSWLQLRKPQRLWALYRQAQRKLEDLQIKYRYKIEPFDSSTTADKNLVSETAAIALDVHYKWKASCRIQTHLAAFQPQQSTAQTIDDTSGKNSNRS